MTVLTRSALESSPLADLHAIAGELGLDGFRRLRKADLVDAILARQAGEDEADGAEAQEVPEQTSESADEGGGGRRRGRRGGRGRRSARSEEGATDEDAGTGDAEEVVIESVPEVRPEAEAEPAPAARRRGGAKREDQTVEGTIELQPNGSAFLRETGDEDVYISAAQVRRCELVDGDRVGGPVRPARRSERHPSLVRVQSINGRDADEVAEGTPFEELPAAFPTEAFALGEDDDPTLKAIGALAPLGRGSRAVIAGPARTGKSEILRRLAGALHAQEDLDLSVVLCGVRPEELSLWQAEGLPEPVASLSLAAAPDAQAQALERALDTARRVAARGGHAVALVDSLAWVGPGAARKALAAARSIPDGGSLTVVAVAPEPVGGESTVVALDAVMAATGRFPALDLLASGTLHPERLVGEEGAAAIVAARAEILERA